MASISRTKSLSLVIVCMSVCTQLSYTAPGINLLARVASDIASNSARFGLSLCKQVPKIATRQFATSCPVCVAAVKQDLNKAFKLINSPLLGSQVNKELNDIERDFFKSVIDNAIKAKVDLNMVHQETQWHLTPLHLATILQQTTIIKKLYQAGVNVNVRSRWGHTPLHYAVCLTFGSREIVGELLKARSDLAAQDNDGKTPFELTTSSDIKKILVVESLKRTGLPVKESTEFIIEKLLLADDVRAAELIKKINQEQIKDQPVSQEYRPYIGGVFLR